MLRVQWLVVYVLTTSKVISVGTHDDFINADSLGNQVASIMPQYIVLSGIILILANQSLTYPNSAKSQAREVTSINFISHWFDSTVNRYLGRKTNN